MKMLENLMRRSPGGARGQRRRCILRLDDAAKTDEPIVIEDDEPAVGTKDKPIVIEDDKWRELDTHGLNST